MDGPSPHLTWAELGCRDGTPYPVRWRETRAEPLADEFERIRTACDDTPLRVNSAYRTLEYQIALYRRLQRRRPRWSGHVEGIALDLAPTGDLEVRELHEATRETARRGASLIKGIGYYEWGVHFDLRDTDQLYVWGSSRPPESE